MRRIALTTLLSVVVLLLGALPAAAAVTARVGSPSPGQEITGSVAIQVCVTRDNPLTEPYPGSADVRLSRDGNSAVAGSTTAQVTQSSQDCASGGRAYTGKDLDPRSPGDFGLTEPLANGTWHVQTRVNDGSWSGSEVTVSVPPSPVRDVSASADRLDVALTWTRAPEPDISAYRIQRRPDGGSWQVISSVGSSSSSYQDTTPSAGTYEYRVVTVRPDGHGSVLTATSSATPVTTTSSGPGPSPSDGTTSDGGTSSGGTSGDGSTADDGSGSTDGSSGTGTDDTSDETAGPSSDGSTSVDGTAASGEDGDGGSASTRGSGGTRRIAPPPGVRQGTALDLDARLPDPEVAPREDERFYGEGEGFSEELDYGGAQAAAPGAGDAEGGTVLQRIPGGVQEFIVSRFETRTLLRSIAAGLLFVALGLHAYRWMHATPHH